MPDSVEGRLNRLERDAAALEQRVNDLSAQVKAFAPMVREMADVVADVRGIKDDIRDLGVGVGSIKASLEDRDKRADDERRSMKVALVSLTAVIGAALIAALATIVAAGIHP